MSFLYLKIDKLYANNNLLIYNSNLLTVNFNLTHKEYTAYIKIRINK